MKSTPDQPVPARAGAKPVKVAAAQVDVRALSRGVELLKVLARDGGARDMSLSDLALATGLHKSTVHRLAGVLLREDLLTRQPDTERYRLGVAALELGGAYLDRLTPRREAMPYLEQLMTTTNETVHLGILDKHEVVYIEKIEAPANVIVHTRIGHREMAHCTALGKAMLAFVPEEEIEAVIAAGLSVRTRTTITDPRKLRVALALVRKRGFAVNLEESRELVNAVAAPIFDRNGSPVAAIVISGLKQRLPMERLLELGLLLKQTAAQVSIRMGFVAARQTHAA